MKSFSKSWKSSKKVKKQRKYRYNAPKHIKRKFLSSNLSKGLREKYNTRSFKLKKGDKVKIMRGQFKGKASKVDRVDLKKSKVYLEGIGFDKRDGSKSFYPISPSNLMITELILDDKMRQKAIKRKSK